MNRKRMICRVPLGILALTALAVLCSSTGAIAAAAGLGYKVTERIAGADGGWDAATFDPQLRRPYVARTDGIMAIDVDSGMATAQLVKGDRTHQVAPIGDGHEFIFTNGGTNQAIIADARSGAVLAAIATGEGPDAVIYDPRTKLVLVMNHRSGSATVIDPAARKAIATIAVGGPPEFAALDGRGHVFVNIEDQAKIAVIDIAKQTVSTRIELLGCTEPTGLVYAGGRLYAACSNGVLKVVVAATGAEVASLPIGQRPDGVIIDSKRHMVFVPCGGDGTLSIFKLGGVAPMPMGSIATKRGARTGDVDEMTGRVYLPSAEYLPPVPPATRPAPKAGTFAVLVVAP